MNRTIQFWNFIVDFRHYEPFPSKIGRKYHRVKKHPKVDENRSTISFHFFEVEQKIVFSTVFSSILNRRCGKTCSNLMNMGVGSHAKKNNNLFCRSFTHFCRLLQCFDEKKKTVCFGYCTYSSILNMILWP